jgi:hypothetical protein
MKSEFIQSTVNNVASKKGKFLAIDPNDKIVECLAQGTNANVINDYSCLKNYARTRPVIFRGMTQRKVVTACAKQKRDFYYIDTGYIGNLAKHKRWHRVVKNGMQHSHPRYDLPSDRFDQMITSISYNNVKFNSWKPEGRAILLVTPSDKPCKYYGINRDEWVAETIAKIKEHTDREIIVRNKAERRSDRVKDGSIYTQFEEDDIYAVVTYNSIAAIEAIGYGIPAFTLAPTIADALCYDDLSKIESPMYADPEQVAQWQNWIGYCQYTTSEMVDGTVMRMIKEYNLK